jgi:hypothetical protein
MDYGKMGKDFMKAALPLIITGLIAGLTAVSKDFEGYTKKEEPPQQ